MAPLCLFHVFFKIYLCVVFCQTMTPHHFVVKRSRKGLDELSYLTYTREQNHRLFCQLAEGQQGASSAC